MRTTLVILTLLLLPAAAISAAGIPLATPTAAEAPSAPQPVPEVVAGFTIAPFLPAPVPTAIEFGPDGHLYMTTLAGEVVRADLDWTPAGPVVLGTATVASGFSQPLGIELDESAIYVADSSAGAESGRLDGRVTRIAGEERAVIVDGLPNGRHNTNNLRFGPDDRLYITNGNPNDNGIDGGEADVLPVSGAILSVDVAEVAASPAVFRWLDENGDPIPATELAAHAVNTDFREKVDVYASGFRNVYDVAFGPTGHGYTGMNGADTPSSQDALFKLSPGIDYAYPFCYNEGAPGAVGAGVSVVTNPTFPGHDCTGVPAATALLGWHICATGLDFPTAGPAAFPASMHNSVFVAECGPFFPEPTAKGVSTHDTGHKVARVALDANGDAVSVNDFVTGLALPTDARFGPDGALYIADADMIYRVAPAVPTIRMDAQPAADGETIPVVAAGFNFLSPALVVPVGTTVEWRSQLLPHTVTTANTLEDARAGKANDRLNRDDNPDTFHAALPQGGVVRHMFNVPGEYYYFCEPHHGLGMVGIVRVV